MFKRKRKNDSNEPKIYFADDLIAIYNEFKENVYNPQSVLYPSCGFDASPAKVFDDVTFVDLEYGNKGCVRKLQQAGLHALNKDIREYKPAKEHDLLILLNPAIPSEWASRHLKSGGYILANDYHQNSSEIYRNPDDFSLWGVIDLVEREGKNQRYSANFSRNLEGLFEPVSNESELMIFRPKHHEFLKTMFSSLAINMENFNADRPFEQVWSDYRELMGEGMPSKRFADRYIFLKK